MLTWREKCCSVQSLPAKYFLQTLNIQNIFYLALDIAGFVSVTAAIRRKFLPALLYKPIDRPAVSDEELFAVSGPATQTVNMNTTSLQGTDYYKISLGGLYAFLVSR